MMTNRYNPEKASLLAYRFKRALISFVYPNRCPFCDTVIGMNEYFCNGCNKLDKHSDLLDIKAYCLYNDVSKPFIFEAKENGNGYAISAAAYLLYNELSHDSKLSDCDLVVPIPSRKAALKARGYSFPALLAKETAVFMKKRCSYKCLIKSRENSEQKSFSETERVLNVKDSFGIGKDKCNGLKILVIDDVSTTGATLNEARRVLLENGAVSVELAAFAATKIDY